MKIAVATDSNSGITQQQGRELGIFVIPMPFMIDGKTYYEDIDLSQDEFYERLDSGSDIMTSQPSPEAVTKLWDEALMTYDSLVYIPMSSGLSGSCQTASALALDYGGRVHVINNQRISVTQRQSVLDAVMLADAGKTADEIKNILESAKFESSIYIMVDTLKYLKKGGRITPAAAALGTLLKLKPILTIQGEKLDAFSKARTVKQAKSIITAAMQSDLEKRFSDEKCLNGFLEIAHSNNLEAAMEFKEEIQEKYPDIDIYMDDLSLSVACHTGPGTLALAYSKKIVF